MTYTIDMAYSHGVPSVENQKALLKGEIRGEFTSKYAYKFTYKSDLNQFTVFTEASLTPVIESKMSGKYLAEKLIEELIPKIADKRESINYGKAIYIVLPTKKSPCLSIQEKENGEVMLRAEVSFYMG
jgi:hypothetical protein